MTSRSSGRSRGFTLIEILVVLVIMGLALAIVAGFLPRGHVGLDLATSADQLAGTLRLARTRAIATQQPVVFAAAADGHGFLIDGKAQALPRSVVLSLPGAAWIRFAPDGSSSGGAIRLSAGTLSRTLRVDWLTGRTVVADAH